jgi:hypothetical protein
VYVAEDIIFKPKIDNTIVEKKDDDLAKEMKVNPRHNLQV